MSTLIGKPETPPETASVDQSELIRRWAAMTKWLRHKQQGWKELERRHGKWKTRLYVPFVFPFVLLLVFLGEASVRLGEHIEEFGYWLGRKVL